MPLRTGRSFTLGTAHGLLGVIGLPIKTTVLPLAGLRHVVEFFDTFALV